MTSMADTVCALVEDAPGSNVDELLPKLPQYSRAQIKSALHQLTFDGRLRCVRQGGKTPGRYYPARVDKPISAIVNSVFALGARA